MLIAPENYSLQLFNIIHGSIDNYQTRVIIETTFRNLKMGGKGGNRTNFLTTGLGVAP